MNWIISFRMGIVGNWHCFAHIFYSLTDKSIVLLVLHCFCILATATATTSKFLNWLWSCFSCILIIILKQGSFMLLKLIDLHTEHNNNNRYSHKFSIKLEFSCFLFVRNTHSTVLFYYYYKLHIKDRKVFFGEYNFDNCSI